MDEGAEREGRGPSLDDRVDFCVLNLPRGVGLPPICAAGPPKFFRVELAVAVNANADTQPTVSPAQMSFRGAPRGGRGGGDRGGRGGGFSRGGGQSPSLYHENAAARDLRHCTIGVEGWMDVEEAHGTVQRRRRTDQLTFLLLALPRSSRRWIQRSGWRPWRIRRLQRRASR